MDYRKRLAPIKGFLLDMDGTVYLDDKMLEGSLAFLEKLRQTGRSALFLTNNSSKSAEVYVQKLKRLGVTEPFLQVLTSGQAAGSYVYYRISPDSAHFYWVMICYAPNWTYGCC